VSRQRQHVALRPPESSSRSPALTPAEREQATTDYGALLPNRASRSRARSAGSLPLPDAIALTALLGLLSLAASGWVDSALPWAR
jgi:hypothetical protein